MKRSKQLLIILFSLATLGSQAQFNLDLKSLVRPVVDGIVVEKTRKAQNAAQESTSKSVKAGI